MVRDEPACRRPLWRAALLAVCGAVVAVAVSGAFLQLDRNLRENAGFAALGVAGAMAAWGGVRALGARRRSRREAGAAELARLSWRLEFALCTSEIGVWDVDLATDELIWDDQARKLFGIREVRPFYSEADWLGAIHPEDRNQALAETNAAISGNGRFRTSYRVRWGDGTIRHIRDTASLYVGQDGSRRLVGLVQDVTDIVEREQELNQRRGEAEAATVAKSRFLATMSHEIRTPMTGVLGLIGLMLEGELQAVQRERATLALASADQLLEILNDILDFSRLEAHQIQVVSEPVQVRRLVKDVASLMATAASRKGVDFRTVIDGEVPDWVMTDALRLRQVLVNLMSNAVKFTNAGEIVVSVRHDPDSAGGLLRFAVRDTGIGVAPKQIDLIFQHFVQGDNSLTRKAGGTGLGLAISRELVRLMGGSLDVESPPGGGSTFSFSVLAPQVTASMAAATGKRAPQSLVRPMRILLAEDNLTNQYVIGAFLRGAGHAVETAQNGREALAAVREGTFDVVLMDVHMPEMDGLTTATAIRALPPPVGTVPIIALTANALQGDREACIAAGMSDYLSKPVDTAALHAALARVLAG